MCANQVAQQFKAAVDNAFLGPADQVITFPALVNVPTPQEIVAVADTAVDSVSQPEFNPRLALPELDATLLPASLLLHELCPSPPLTLDPFPADAAAVDADMLSIAGSELLLNPSPVPGTQPNSESLQYQADLDDPMEN